MANEKENQGAAAPRTALSPAQIRRIAREARRLAIECVAGTAPQFGTGQEFYPNGRPCCSMGHAAHRAGIRASGFHEMAPVACALPRHEAESYGGAWALTANANDRMPEALPWALLSLADALDASASEPPKATP